MTYELGQIHASLAGRGRFETNIAGHWKANMFDALGRRVMEIENQTEVRIESLRPGLYFVKIG